MKSQTASLAHLGVFAMVLVTLATLPHPGLSRAVSSETVVVGAPSGNVGRGECNDACLSSTDCLTKDCPFCVGRDREARCVSGAG